MAYTNEEIERYLDILNNYSDQSSIPKDDVDDNVFRCWNCQSDCFYVESGFYFCESCDSSNGHALGYFDLREYDRFHYRRKSIYQRRYHYEKKVRQISKRLFLTDDEYYCLFNRLMEIDQDTITKINKLFLSQENEIFFYLIKKCLEEMGCEKHYQIGLKISKQTQENYEQWWKCLNL